MLSSVLTITYTILDPQRAAEAEAARNALMYLGQLTDTGAVVPDTYDYCTHAYIHP